MLTGEEETKGWSPDSGNNNNRELMDSFGGMQLQEGGNKKHAIHDDIHNDIQSLADSDVDMEEVDVDGDPRKGTPTPIATPRRRPAPSLDGGADADDGADDEVHTVTVGSGAEQMEAVGLVVNNTIVCNPDDPAENASYVEMWTALGSPSIPSMMVCASSVVTATTLLQTIRGRLMMSEETRSRGPIAVLLHSYAVMGFPASVCVSLEMVAKVNQELTYRVTRLAHGILQRLVRDAALQEQTHRGSGGEHVVRFELPLCTDPLSLRQVEELVYDTYTSCVKAVHYSSMLITATGLVATSCSTDHVITAALPPNHYLYVAPSLEERMTPEQAVQRSLLMKLCERNFRRKGNDVMEPVIVTHGRGESQQQFNTTSFSVWGTIQKFVEDATAMDRDMTAWVGRGSKPTTNLVTNLTNCNNGLFRVFSPTQGVYSNNDAVLDFASKNMAFYFYNAKSKRVQALQRLAADAFVAVQLHAQRLQAAHGRIVRMMSALQPVLQTEEDIEHLVQELGMVTAALESCAADAEGGNERHQRLADLQRVTQDRMVDAAMKMAELRRGVIAAVQGAAAAPCVAVNEDLDDDGGHAAEIDAAIRAEQRQMDRDVEAVLHDCDDMDDDEWCQQFPAWVRKVVTCAVHLKRVERHLKCQFQATQASASLVENLVQVGPPPSHLVAELHRDQRFPFGAMVKFFTPSSRREVPIGEGEADGEEDSSWLRDASSALVLDWRNIETEVWDHLFSYQELPQDAVEFFAHIMTGRMIYPPNLYDDKQINKYVMGMGGTGKGKQSEYEISLHSTEDRTVDRTGVIPNNIENPFGPSQVLGYHEEDRVFAAVCPDVTKEMKFLFPIGSVLVWVAHDPGRWPVKKGEVVDARAPHTSWYSNIYMPHKDNGGNIIRRFVIMECNKVVTNTDTTIGKRVQAMWIQLTIKCAFAYREWAARTADQGAWNPGVMPQYVHETSRRFMCAKWPLMGFLLSQDGSQVQLDDSLPDFIRVGADGKTRYRGCMTYQQLQTIVDSHVGSQHGGEAVDWADSGTIKLALSKCGCALVKPNSMEEKELNTMVLPPRIPPTSNSMWVVGVEFVGNRDHDA